MTTEGQKTGQKKGQRGTKQFRKRDKQSTTTQQINKGQKQKPGHNKTCKTRLAQTSPKKTWNKTTTNT